ncbi:MAG TPA: large conductance mechanosensitive channel protein MscL [Streptosporangiaceae bacterium]|nr:large conductance mechanosensitive channel protein MscL [Streptosporangiaceae bacterium]
MGGFRKFLMRGNIIDLAVAVVMGVAFNAIIQALVNDMITPLLAVIFDNNQKKYEGLSFHIGQTPFKYGAVISAAVSFLVIAAVVYWLIVAPTSKLTALATRNKQLAERPCPECLSTIPVEAKRCMYCTSEVPPVPPTSTTTQRRPRHGFLPSDLSSLSQRFKGQPDEGAEL